MIHYKIGSINPAGHYFDVYLKIEKPSPIGQQLRLPAWIPGSYMIRDFAKNIVEISAKREGEPIEIIQLDKSTWQLEDGSGLVEVFYRVYAWDLSVRTAHLDTTHGFFNGSSVFLEVIGMSEQSCQVEIVKPGLTQCSEWKLATTLSSNSNLNFEFGHFKAENYAELIDHPVEMGCFDQVEFVACSVRHDVVLTGAFNCDYDRLTQDLKKICEHQIEMFGEPAPMSRYLFLVMVVGDGYGGLEHRSSTSLICSRDSLPQPGQSEMTSSYRDFLGLCSHEYFHSWNVKRIKPEVFVNPDLSKEVYTPLLWAFEGITSYYDDLVLVRSGLISTNDYLELLGQTITRVIRGKGRKRQSAAESSFNAWSKFYKQDENAANGIVSYYAKGCLIALCIDLKIRLLTQSKKSLDDVMCLLWKQYQKNGKGVSNNDIQNLVCEVSAADLSDFLNEIIYLTEELPLTALLETVSLKLDFRVSDILNDKGGTDKDDLPLSTLSLVVKTIQSDLKVIAVAEDGAAQQAGLSAGDTILAINGIRATESSYQSWLKLSQPGTKHTVTVFRRDELMSFETVLQQPQQDTAFIGVIDSNSQNLTNWLRQSNEK